MLARPRAASWKGHGGSVAAAASQFALWNVGNLGYLTIYALGALFKGTSKGNVGEKIKAGRLGEYTIQMIPAPSFFIIPI
jgi:hypothetical protein